MLTISRQFYVSADCTILTLYVYVYHLIRRNIAYFFEKYRSKSKEYAIIDKIIDLKKTKIQSILNEFSALYQNKKQPFFLSTNNKSRSLELTLETQKYPVFKD